MRGRIISVSGIDGCGKTTVIENLKVRLVEEGQSVHYVWMRYNHYLTKPLLVFCRFVGLTWYESDDPRVGYHEFYRSGFISWLFIFLTFLDTLWASFFCVYIPAYVFGKTVICDRWVPDIIVDLGVDTRKSVLPSVFWVKLFLALVSRKARCFVLFRDSSEVEKARSEHEIDKNYPLRRDLFEKLGTFPMLKVVDNNSSIDAPVRQIMDSI